MCNNKRMEKIGILGGTFNPVHSEHISLAKKAVKALNLDKLIIMPTYLPPHKEIIPAPASDRLNMLKLAFQGEDKIEVSDYEIEKQGKSYTYLTVEHFKEKLSANLYFIVGGDMLTDFKTWRNPDRILKACDLCVFGRDDFFTDYQAEEEYFIKNFGKSFIKIGYDGKAFSSTKIRIYASLGLDVSSLTCPSVANYIAEKGLYKGDFYAEFLQRVLTEKRRIHTAGVVDCAMRKVKELKLDANKVLTSAMLHDCAKYLDPKDFKDFTIEDDVPKPVVHAFLGAFVAQKVLGIEDEEILDAIRYHTSGKANMSSLAKLILVADMVEEGRDYEGVEYLRDLYEKDFEFCFKECLREELIHLKNKGTPIYKETINAYNFYVNEGEK